MRQVLKNRYEVIGILGRGGMGRVFKVADRINGQTLAIKELYLRKLSPDAAQEALTQFWTEARILMRLNHPNFPKVFGCFSESGASYLVMEYVRGKTLEQILDARAGQPIDEHRTLGWALQITRALHFLGVQQPRPVVFRDLKPANIMIDRTGRVKLIDFGIARFFTADKSEDTYVYGTPGYAAPEQYGTGQTDVRSDLFALGATMHHCLTGLRPVEGSRQFPDLRRINSRVNPATAAIVNKALSRERGRRFPNAQEMKAAIEQVLLAFAMPGQGLGKVFLAEPGRTITLPWQKKTALIGVPIRALGLSGTTGTLRTEDPWIAPQTATFGPDASWALFRVRSNSLIPGREYRTRITAFTDCGVLRPRLVLKRRRPWMLIGIVAAVLAVVAAMLRA